MIWNLFMWWIFRMLYSGFLLSFSPEALYSSRSLSLLLDQNQIKIKFNENKKGSSSISEAETQTMQHLFWIWINGFWSFFCAAPFSKRFSKYQSPAFFHSHSLDSLHIIIHPYVGIQRERTTAKNIHRMTKT